MADKFEKSMPEFWKGLTGKKSFEICGATALTLFIALNVEIRGLQTQVSDLHRYAQQLVARDESERRDQERDADKGAVRKTLEKNMQDWRDTTLRIEEDVEKLDDDADRSLQAIKKNIGDLRVRLSALENRPLPPPEPAKKPSNTPPKKELTGAGNSARP